MLNMKSEKERKIYNKIFNFLHELNRNQTLPLRHTIAKTGIVPGSTDKTYRLLDALVEAGYIEYFDKNGKTRVVFPGDFGKYQVAHATNNNTNRATVNKSIAVIYDGNKYLCPFCWDNLEIKEEVNLYCKRDQAKIYQCPVCSKFSHFAVRDKLRVAKRNIHLDLGNGFVACGKHIFKTRYGAIRSPPLETKKTKSKITCYHCKRSKKEVENNGL